MYVPLAFNKFLVWRLVQSEIHKSISNGGLMQSGGWGGGEVLVILIWGGVLLILFFFLFSKLLGHDDYLISDSIINVYHVLSIARFFAIAILRNLDLL